MGCRASGSSSGGQGQFSFWFRATGPTRRPRKTFWDRPLSVPWAWASAVWSSGKDGWPLALATPASWSSGHSKMSSNLPSLPTKTPEEMVAQGTPANSTRPQHCGRPERLRVALSRLWALAACPQHRVRLGAGGALCPGALLTRF